MADHTHIRRLIWGILLFAAGFLMFVTIPGRVREIQDAGRYIPGLRFGFYVISVFLMIGGGRKIYEHTRKTGKDDPES
ncbi:hypothetical protein JCM14469_17940 [Desulfatiferula olefinivorans]